MKWDRSKLNPGDILRYPGREDYYVIDYVVPATPAEALFRVDYVLVVLNHFNSLGQKDGVQRLYLSHASKLEHTPCNSTETKSK